MAGRPIRRARMAMNGAGAPTQEQLDRYDREAREKARNPNTPVDHLLAIASDYPDETLDNPILPLLSLEDPSLYAQLMMLIHIGFMQRYVYSADDIIKDFVQYRRALLAIQRAAREIGAAAEEDFDNLPDIMEDAQAGERHPYVLCQLLHFLAGSYSSRVAHRQGLLEAKMSGLRMAGEIVSRISGTPMPNLPMTANRGRHGW